MNDLEKKAAFWKVKSFDEMTDQEWESLCDHCGRCCLHKLEDPETSDIIFTTVACHLLDQQSCACQSYETRQQKVSDCVNIRTSTSFNYHFLPKSCAYRRLDEGRSLAAWHPLISGDVRSVHEAGISVSDQVVSDIDVKEDDFILHLAHWIDA
ncbi:MAG: YcgN family cysteine cluster protein [Mariprofundaceae bacterium]|nr:YcgN family cysteine cluster protein [Mariprofundaceae bacterium]